MARTIPKKKKIKKADWLFERLYKQLRKEEKQRVREKETDILNRMQSYREWQEDIARPSSMNNAKK